MKTRYKGLDAVREKDGDEAAIEEFFRRRRGERYESDVHSKNCTAFFPCRAAVAQQ